MPPLRPLALARHLEAPLTETGFTLDAGKLPGLVATTPLLYRCAIDAQADGEQVSLPEALEKPPETAVPEAPLAGSD
jgi:hypothetical protein